MVCRRSATVESQISAVKNRHTRDVTRRTHGSWRWHLRCRCRQPMLSGTSRFGDYDVVAPLASGGMGGVYLARHGTSGEQVALKVLDPLFANHPEVVARSEEHT